MYAFLNKRVHSRSGGFSLVEIMIAVAILGLVTVPLALGIMSGSRINANTKNMKDASDIGSSITDSIKSVQVSDILKDANGCGGADYSAALPYSFQNILTGYRIGDVFEANISNGQYLPVVTQIGENDEGEPVLLSDEDVNSSVNLRVVDGNKYRAFFTGNADNKYSVVLRGVEKIDKSDADGIGSASFDVVMDFKPADNSQIGASEQSSAVSDIINISSSNQSGVSTVSNKLEYDENAASEFARRNSVYCKANNLDNTFRHDKTWFMNNMSRRFIIEIKANPASINNGIKIIDVVVRVEYDAPDGSVAESDSSYKREIGSFSTSNSDDYLNGVYLFYYPFLDTTDSRDSFVVKNEDNVKAPLYLVAIGDTASKDISNNKYHPSLKLTETLSLDVDLKTSFCSNVNDDYWTEKLLYNGEIQAPDTDSRVITVKGLGNKTEQQIMYDVDLKVYNHKSSCWENDGTFIPNEKYLLAKTNSSLLDTSIKEVIVNDDLSAQPSLDYAATATVVLLPSPIYNGSEQTGFDMDRSSNVSWSGNTTGINAGQYVAYATPAAGCVWPDGTHSTRTYTWKIRRSPTAFVEGQTLPYNGSVQDGLNTNNNDSAIELISGVRAKTDVGRYVAVVAPTSNYCWMQDDEDEAEQNAAQEDVSSRTIEWEITRKEVKLVWTDFVWVYDKTTHEGVCEVANLLPNESECRAIVVNNKIRDVGTVTAEVVGLTNPNYALPADTTKVLEVKTNPAAVIEVTNKEYNGIEQSGIDYIRGVVVEGVTRATSVSSDGYRIVAVPEEGYEWYIEGGTSPKEFIWRITPKYVNVVWGEETSWVYDGQVHNATCYVSSEDLASNTPCNVKLDNNGITNVGTKTVSISDVFSDNKNYQLAPYAVTEKEIRVVPSKTASFSVPANAVYGNKNYSVVLNNASGTGTLSAKNVGQYTCSITPDSNYAWPDGTTDSKEVSWSILPVCDAVAFGGNYSYTGSEIQGVQGRYVTVDETQLGTLSETEIGAYKGYVKPAENHAWKYNANGSLNDASVLINNQSAYEELFETREISWSISDSHNILPSFVGGTGDARYEYSGSGISVEVNVGPATITQAMIDGTDAMPSFIDSVSGTLTGTEPGTYNVSIVLKADSGYSWLGNQSLDKTPEEIRTFDAEWRIIPRNVTMAPENALARVPYNGSTYQISGYAPVNNLVSGHTAQFTYPRTDSSNVGTYSNMKPTVIIKDGLDNDVTSKYNVICQPMTVEIIPRAITVKSNSKTWTYDGAIHVERGVAVTNGSLADGDTVGAVINTSVQNVVMSNGKVVPVKNVISSVSIKHGETDVTSCYSITAENGELLINPASESISVGLETNSTCPSTEIFGEISMNSNSCVVSSSNESVASASVIYNNGTVNIKLTPHSIGSTNITVTTTDQNYIQATHTFSFYVASHASFAQKGGTFVDGSETDRHMQCSRCHVDLDDTYVAVVRGSVNSEPDSTTIS